MELKNAVKKIVALGVGATMLGATILGATAAKLSEYPSPFVVDGKFDGLLVVGDNAKTVDNIGMTEIFGSLQYANRKDFGVTTSSASLTTVSSGVKLEKSGDHLNWGDYLYDMQDTPMDDGDLPVLLKDGAYEDNEGANKQDETYTQVIDVLNATSRYVFDADENNDDKAGSYLHLTDDDDIIKYRLEFDNPIDYGTSSTYTRADDLESTKLEILGQTYTITEASFDGANKIDKLTLLSGDVVVWLTQDVKITRVVDGVEHVIYVVDVSENEDRCGVNVDGTTAWVDVDATETINGIEIGVTDAVSVHTATQDTDVCELSVGANELLLEEGQTVEIGGTEVDGSEVRFDSSGTDWSGFNVSVATEDEMWLAPGAKWVDPVFNSVKIDFANEVYDEETVDFSAGGDTATLKFKNADDDEVEIKWSLDKTNDKVYLGWDYDQDYLLTEQLNGATAVDCDTTSARYDDCEGTKLLVVTSGEVPHVIEITEVDSSNNQTSYKDLTTGTTFTDKDVNVQHAQAANSTYAQNIALGSLGTINLAFNTSGYVYIGDIQLDGKPETKYGLQLTRLTNDTMYFLEEDDESDQMNMTFKLIADDDDRIETTGTVTLASIVGSQYNAADIDESSTDDDTSWWATEWGSRIKMDTDDPEQTFTIYYPDEQRYANVFISPVDAEITTVTSAGGDVVRIDVGASILASEIPGGLSDHNLLLVGGPCVNSAAATLMDNPDPCYADFEEGKAMIKLFPNGDNVAILVAGYSGQDTRAAARYLANYDKHTDVFGKASDEISLSVTSLDKVNAEVPTSE